MIHNKYCYLKFVLVFVVLSITKLSVIVNAKKTKNCYEKLGIPTDAHPKVVKRAFRKLALKYHPDKASNKEEADKNEEIFKGLAHCYELLSDEEKRAQYDANGFQEFDGSSSNFGHQSFSNIFEQFFGGSGRGRGGGGAQNMFFETDASGNSHTFSFSGSGAGAGSQDPFASFFGGGGGSGSGGGRGHQQANGHGFGGQRQQQQRDRAQKKPQLKKKKVLVDLEDLLDDSTKLVEIKHCSSSNNRCKSKSVEIEIPKGCPDGHTIKSKKYGYVFEIFSKRHAQFERGNKLGFARSDLYVNKNITLEDALLGFNLEVVTIDNEFVEVDIESIPVNSQYKLRNKGLPRFSSKSNTDGQVQTQSRGHLIIEFNVLYPVLNGRQKDNLKQLLSDEQEQGQEPWDYSDAIKYHQKQYKKKSRTNRK